jgi:hypothetical protein
MGRPADSDGKGLVHWVPTLGVLPMIIVIRM